MGASRDFWEPVASGGRVEAGRMVGLLDVRHTKDRIKRGGFILNHTLLLSVCLSQILFF